MKKINEIKQLTKGPYLSMYLLDMVTETNKHWDYYVVSRSNTIERLKLKTKENPAEGVIVYAIYIDPVTQEEKVVLVRQYRCTIDDYIYEFPAGLVEPGEAYEVSGARELKEETGLDFIPLEVDFMYKKPMFTTIGMTDEACGTIYGYAKGTPSISGQEETEEIEIVLANREEVKRILKEEKIAIMCGYMLMHFVNTPEGHVFDFLKGDQDHE